MELFRIWEFHERRTLDTFGVAFVDLPAWLSDDLIALVGMRAWHEMNKDLPDASSTPSIDAMF